MQPLSDDESVSVSYFELEGTLLLSGSSAGAAECHGMLCGLACTSPRFDEQKWLTHVLGDAETASILSDTRELLQAVAADTLYKLDFIEAGFQPLLPDDHQAMCDRLEALVDWCGGFLLGFRLGRVSELPALSSDSREFIVDMQQLMRLDVLSGEGGEESEVAFTELVEYVKVGVLLLREEVYVYGGGANATRTLQ